MNALEAEFEFEVIDLERSLSLTQGDGVRIYPLGRNKRFGEDLTERQIDLIRIAMAVYTADSWVLRKAKFNRLRNPHVRIEVLDAPFWSQPETMTVLKECVDFVSGGDDWEFSFVSDTKVRHERPARLFAGYGHDVLVTPYSGGLDSSSGLALRAAAQSGRVIVPVTIRHQLQKSRLFRDQFDLLRTRGILKRGDFNPFQAGAFIRKKRIKRELKVEFREITHRCRPLLFMAIAGIVANSLSTSEVEIFESGVGSLNLPLVTGPADYRTTRSTHPYFLELMGRLISRVNDSSSRYVLPFADKTKAEVVAAVKDLGLEQFARNSISCILHPLKRPGRRQCGGCPACVYRRHAMLTAGIVEDSDAYGTDLFAEADVRNPIPPKYLRCIQAFHEQIAHLAELDHGVAPASFRRYLKSTKAVMIDEQIAPYAEVYRRYRQEWLALVADARRRGLPWITKVGSPAIREGAGR